MKLPIEYVEKRKKYVLFKNDCGITDTIRGGGVYEAYIFEHIRKNVPVEGSTIIDIGANLGQHALEFADLVGPQGTVHSFEAQRLVYYQLCANIFLNGVPNIFAHHLAIGDKEDNIQMETPNYYSAETINVGNAHVNRFLSVSEAVKMRTLDSFNFNNVSVIKLDVEGYEPFVLDGAKDTIERNRPILFIEVWDYNLRVYDFEEEAVFSRLSAMGYRWKKLIDHSIDYVAEPISSNRIEF
jgi:FkbM family methyltransferase